MEEDATKIQGQGKGARQVQEDAIKIEGRGQKQGLILAGRLLDGPECPLVHLHALHTVKKIIAGKINFN